MKLTIHFHLAQRLEMSGAISRPTARPYSLMAYRGKNLRPVLDAYFGGKKA